MGQAESFRNIKSKFVRLKRGQRFIDYHASGPCALELEQLLDEIEGVGGDPRQGVELVASFIQTDMAVLSRADDSNGSIGDVYRILACESFVSYASKCEDKAWLYDRVLLLYKQDEHGVRDSLIATVASFLPESFCRRLVDEFWVLAAQESCEYKRYHWYFGIEAIARQLKDPALFERACRAKWPELPTAGYLDIAEAYFECGYAIAALEWLEKVPPSESFKLDERERLLLKVISELGDLTRAEEVAWRIFRRSRSADGLSLLINVIGEGESQRVADSEVATIVASPKLDYVDASFLMELQRFDDAERYIVDRSTQLNGDYYTRLLPWAKKFETHQRLFVASLIYRALLNSILARANSKYYSYGVRYLRRLDDLAPKVNNWGGLPSHEDYKLALKVQHKRKFRFWGSYEQ